MVREIRPSHTFDRTRGRDLRPQAERADDLALELRVGFEQAFIKELSYTKLSDKIKQHILQKELTVPLVEVMTETKQIQQRTRELGFQRGGESLYPDESLIVVHLPHILRHPHIHEKQAGENNVLGVLEQLYWAGIDGLWSAVRTFCKTHALEVQRLNYPRQHNNDPDGYYYVFALTPQGRPPIPWTTETRTREEPIEESEL